MKKTRPVAGKPVPADLIADPNVWVDKKGTKFVIPELTDEHLHNILKMLYRKNVRKLRDQLLAEADKLDTSEAWTSLDSPTSVDHHFANERRDLAAGTDLAVLNHFIPQLPALEFEARRRGLYKPLFPRTPRPEAPPEPDAGQQGSKHKP